MGDHAECIDTLVRYNLFSPFLQEWPKLATSSIVYGGTSAFFIFWGYLTLGLGDHALFGPRPLILLKEITFYFSKGDEPKF